MSKKLIATTVIFATDLSLSTAPAQARTFVRVAHQCSAFNNAGQKVSNVRPGFFR